MRYFAALAVLQLVALSAHATCMFARDTKPEDWYQWAIVLVAADVTRVESRGSVDLVSLSVVETFKGPEHAEAATLEVPKTLWDVCRLPRPAVGDRVLGALNANNDALLVPLSADYAERLRAVRPASGDDAPSR